MINRHLVSLGIADASLVHCREVFRPAIHDGAMNILVAHNHPSGDPTPSSEDVQITRKLVDAGRIIGIELLDHVIIGRPMKPVGNTPATPPFLSLREAGLCAFE
jgi:DNA repair protein RadC